MSQGCFLSVLRLSEGRSRVSRKFQVFQESFKDVTREFQGCFKEVLRVFQGSLKDVSRKFLGCFTEVSGMFPKSCKIFQESFECV